MNFDAPVAARRDASPSTADTPTNAPTTSSTDIFDKVGLIGRTPVMLELREAIRRFALDRHDPCPRRDG
nr:hypothetical protein [Deltaproteobacteria bacterium]